MSHNTQIQEDTIISRAEDLYTAEIDGEIVIINIDQGCYYGLEKTAKRIWTLLDTPYRFADLCKRLCQEYAATPGVVEADVRVFIEDIANEKIISLK